MVWNWRALRLFPVQLRTRIRQWTKDQTSSTCEMEGEDTPMTLKFHAKETAYRQSATCFHCLWADDRRAASAANLGFYLQIISWCTYCLGCVGCRMSRVCACSFDGKVRRDRAWSFQQQEDRVMTDGLILLHININTNMSIAMNLTPSAWEIITKSSARSFCEAMR
jgi:hypothetical protein